VRRSEERPDEYAARDDVDESFTSWYQAEYNGLVRAIVLVTGNAEVATEAVSEAFARALQRWSRVSNMTSPTGWTYMVALNVARRSIRRARLEALLLRRVAATPPIRDDDLEVWDAVQRLPVRQRTAVALHYLSDLSQKDVATAMGIAEGTVSATLHHARQQLAIHLGESVGKNEVEHG
jgi:RNA polymerase sigma-70 factor (ECF subfamily)